MLTLDVPDRTCGTHECRERITHLPCMLRFQVNLVAHTVQCEPDRFIRLRSVQVILNADNYFLSHTNTLSAG